MSRQQALAARQKTEIIKVTKSKNPGSREPGNPIDWDGIAAAYNEGTLTLKELGVEFECSAGAISRRAKLENWPARARITKRTRKTGATFEWRLARALDCQLRELENRWQDGEVGADAQQAEKEARTLNVLIRTAEKLKELETMPSNAKAKSSDKQDQGASKLDRKRLRETLERRLDQLLATADANGIPRPTNGNGT